MPILDKPITRAEYVASRYDIAKSKQKAEDERLASERREQAVERLVGSPSETLLPSVKKKPVPFVDTYEVKAPRVSGTYVVSRVEKPSETFTSEPSRSKLRETYDKSRLKTVVKKIGTPIRDTDKAISGFITSNIEAPLIRRGIWEPGKYYGDIKREGPKFAKFSVGVQSGAYGYFREKPATAFVEYGVSIGAGKIVSGSKRAVRFVTSKTGKTLVVGTTASYAAGAYSNIASSQDRGKATGQELSRLGTGMGAFSRGFKPSGKVILFKSTKPVERVEGFKTISRTKEFEGNVLDIYRGRPTVFSGGVKTEGAGVFRVGSKQYRVLFREKGIFRDVGEGKFLRSSARLDVQPYGYTLSGSRIPTSRLSRASISSEQFVSPREQEVLIKNIAKIKVKGSPQVTRLTVAKGTQLDTSTRIKGASIDLFRGKVIPSTRQTFKGGFKEDVSVEKEGIRQSISRGGLFGRTLKPSKDFDLDVKSNVRAFRRREFISGSDNVLESMSSLKVKPVSLVSESNIKQVVSQRYAQDVAKSRVSFVRGTSKGTISVSQTKTQAPPITSPSISSLSLRSIPKSRVSSSGLDNSARRELSFKSNKSLRSALIPSQVPVMRTSQFPESSLKSARISGTKLRQTNILRQSTSLRNVKLYGGFTKLNVSRIAPPLLLDRKVRISPEVYVPKSSSFKSRFRESYSPSIQAVVLNIKGKKNVFGSSGLTIRPLEI